MTTQKEETALQMNNVNKLLIFFCFTFELLYGKEVILSCLPINPVFSEFIKLYNFKDNELVYCNFLNQEIKACEEINNANFKIYSDTAVFINDLKRDSFKYVVLIDSVKHIGRNKVALRCSVVRFNYNDYLTNNFQVFIDQEIEYWVYLKYNCRQRLWTFKHMKQT